MGYNLGDLLKILLNDEKEFRRIKRQEAKRMRTMRRHRQKRTRTRAQSENA